MMKLLPVVVMGVILGFAVSASAGRVGLGGSSASKDVKTKIYKPTPAIPEPGAALLFAAGFGAVALRRRR